MERKTETGTDAGTGTDIGNKIILNANTQVTGAQTAAVRDAAKNLHRDIRKVFCRTQQPGCQVRLENGKAEKECFWIGVREGALVIQASDELGFIYGIYEISRTFLGVPAFWFWNDQEPQHREEVRIPDGYQFRSRPFRVKYRGWFVNDEVLLHTWMVDREKDKPWEMVFEALLRCGGNMVIPGTDRNARKYAALASGMGLFITHHHAEPLGADMFARVYPDLIPSYDEYPEKFHGLWKDALERQKNEKVIWNLGFRGQGDKPFWADDARYQSDGERGKLMGALIKKQYDYVKGMDADAVCCTNLYGEVMDLYQKGCLHLPDDVMKIWADNGYGKMVSRRQGNRNPRICALPEKKEEANGIYYHVSFYDLQAANHITMLQNAPEFVKKELEQVLERGGDDFWLINCSNVKPHVYYLDFIAQLWRDGDIDLERHRKGYVEKYYGLEEAGQIAERLKEYPLYAAAYGKEEDEHAGEQFTNHVARILVTQYMKDHKERSGELLWATEGRTLAQQVRWYQKICQDGAASYGEYLRKCMQTDALLSGKGQELFRDSVLLQVRIHAHCFRGALLLCGSLLDGLEGNYQGAFYRAGKARKEYLKADSALREREHGKWQGFYGNECLTDIKQTAWVLQGLMAYLRALGDGPHYYRWQREYLYAEKDRRVMLIMNMENHLRDEELFALMEAKLEG